MNTKFYERFNRELAAMELPDELNAKIKALEKVFSIKRPIIQAILYGRHTLKPDELQKIALVLEVCPNWLSGASDKRKAYAGKETAESV